MDGKRLCAGAATDHEERIESAHLPRPCSAFAFWRSRPAPAGPVRRRISLDIRQAGAKVETRAGSFEAGVDGAQPGIAMPAEPGLSYRQEYYKGEAEDRAAVVTVGEERVQAPFGSFEKRVLMTRDLVPTEPKVQELKFYAPGVGLLLSVHTDGGRAELVSHTRGNYFTTTPNTTGAALP